MKRCKRIWLFKMRFFEVKIALCSILITFSLSCCYSKYCSMTGVGQPLVVFLLHFFYFHHSQQPCLKLLEAKKKHQFIHFFIHFPHRFHTRINLKKFNPKNGLKTVCFSTWKKKKKKRILSSTTAWNKFLTKCRAATNDYFNFWLICGLFSLLLVNCLLQNVK